MEIYLRNSFRRLRLLRDLRDFARRIIGNTCRTKVSPLPLEDGGRLECGQVATFAVATRLLSQRCEPSKTKQPGGPKTAEL